MCIINSPSVANMNVPKSKKMKHLSILMGGLLFLASCTEKPKEWAYQKVIKLEGVNPIGIANADGKLWLSDGDHNRLVQINGNGVIEKIVDSLDRPMHIAASGETLFIPQYGNDQIAVFDKKGLFLLQLQDSLDAPAGIGVKGKEKAVADFYNNRILYSDGTKRPWISFGREGSHEGEFYYPTDVQITEQKIWVADAYNNRIQIFDKQGNFLHMMGQDQKMNAATGLFVSETEVLVTDFENNRVLIFDHSGQLKQELKKGIAKATDLLIKDDILHILNYRTGELVLYNLKEKPQ